MDDKYRFKLIFKGELIENSVDAYDLANTIMSLSQSLNRIAQIKYGNEVAESLKININAFKQGSLQSDFLMYLAPITGLIGLLSPAAIQIFHLSREILSTYRTYLDVKKQLKGKSPKKVIAKGDGNIEIHGDNNTVIIVKADEFKALQDKSLSASIAKSVSPLIKDSSTIEQLEIVENDEPIVSIDKDDAQYLVDNEQIQFLPQVKYKGAITKIDKKARSGFITLGSKRLAFSYEKNLPADKFLILVESLKNGIQIYLIGEVSMDYESNPKHMHVKDIQMDQQLF